MFPSFVRKLVSFIYLFFYLNNQYLEFIEFQTMLHRCKHDIDIGYNYTYGYENFAKIKVQINKDISYKNIKSQIIK